MEQLSLFDNDIEQVARAFGDKIIKVLNSVNTKWKDTFYVSEVEIKKWKPNETVLTIVIKTDKADSGANALCYFNTDKTDTQKINEALYEFYKKIGLNKDTEFTTKLTPWNIFVFYHHFDKKYQALERMM